MARAYKTSRMAFNNITWTEVFSKKRYRQYLMIVNLSGEDIWLYMGSDPPDESQSITLSESQGLELDDKPVTAVYVKGVVGSGELELMEA